MRLDSRVDDRGPIGRGHHGEMIGESGTPFNIRSGEGAGSSQPGRPSCPRRSAALRADDSDYPAARPD